jgi:predicted MFS family arabinose efflux permease
VPPAVALSQDDAGFAGALLAAFGVASLIGGLVVAARPSRRGIPNHYRRLLLAIIVSTAPLAVVAHSLALTAVAAFVAGRWWAPTMSCQYSLTVRLAAQLNRH